MKPTTEATFMIAPPRRRSSGSSKPVKCTTARTFTSTISSCRSRFGSGNGVNAPKPLLLMSSTGPGGASPSTNAVTFAAAAANSAGRDRSHAKWFKNWRSAAEKNSAGSRRERLQTTRSGFSFRISSMNDFPIPEDPPVRTTAEKGWSAALAEGTPRTKTASHFHARPGCVPTLRHPQPNAET